jgi:alpha-glucosidase
MHDVDIPPQLEQDPAGIRQPGQGRDPNRTPMQWSNGHLAGFSPPGTQNTWLPLANDYQEINVEDQLNTSGSMLSLYQELLRIRKLHPALQSGSYRSISNSPKGCYLYIRENNQEKLLVCLNFTDQTCTIDPELTAGGSVLLSTHNLQKKNDPTQIVLDPNEGLLILL